MKKELIAGYERFGAYVFFFLYGTNREREKEREREREKKEREREMSCDLRSFSGLETGRSISEDPS